MLRGQDEAHDAFETEEREAARVPEANVGAVEQALGVDEVGGFGMGDPVPDIDVKPPRPRPRWAASSRASSDQLSYLVPTLDGMKAIDRMAAELAARQHGAFSRRQVLATCGSASACDRRLAAGAWLRTRQPLVYTLPECPASWRQRLIAAVLAGPTGTVASHRAAGGLYGLCEGSFVEVTVPRGGQHRLKAVVHQRDVGSDRTTVEGIPSTKVEGTLLDLAAVVDDDRVEQAVEAALRQGLTTTDRVRAQLGAGRHGVARLRRVLERRGSVRAAGSRLEARFLQLLRAAALADPVRQHEVWVGRSRYFLDFAYPDRRLCVELDGRDVHDRADAFQHDRTRQNALVLAGWTVLRFTWADVVERPDQVVGLLTRALAA